MVVPVPTLTPTLALSGLETALLICCPIADVDGTVTRPQAVLPSNRCESGRGRS